MTKDFPCRICGSADLAAVPGFEALARVTSDCVPFPAGGTLARCSACGAIQKIPDTKWRDEIGQIYRSYDAYRQSGGAEQMVFDARASAMTPRSTVLMERLAETAQLPRVGSILDVGCAKGGTLAAFAAIRPGWKLNGLDLDSRNVDGLNQIPGFHRLWTWSSIESLESVDVVTLVHTIEHLEDPYDALRSLRRAVREDGWLFIEVGNAAINPFDLVVADHLLHFSVETLVRVVERAGFAVDAVQSDWVSKEISLVARPARRHADDRQRPDVQFPCERYVRWLQAFVDAARRTAGTTRPFGLFGSSIAATWLCSQMADSVEFFVDEDTSRRGRTHLGRPILSPEEAPSGAIVFMAMIPSIAENIRARLAPLSLALMPPPAIEIDR
jgi:2-polyprenyl-3-methyl-5-hydroxy-6-metoxy-1,4-benzoquinol methylase